MGKLTKAAVRDMVDFMLPQDGEVVVLVFVRKEDGRYLMAAPIPCCWLEMMALLSKERGLVRPLEA